MRVHRANRWFLKRWSILREQAWPAGTGQIVLSFDDGPNREEAVSEALLDVLAEEEVQASFCYVGKLMERHPSIVARAHRDGHHLVFHTDSHTPLPLLFPGRLRQELQQTATRIEEITQSATAAPRHFRSPYGFLPPQVSRVIEEEGLELAHLTFFQTDVWSGPFWADLHLNWMKRAVQRHQGGALVFHENSFLIPINKHWLPPTLQRFIRWAKAEGYAFSSYRDAA